MELPSKLHQSVHSIPVIRCFIVSITRFQRVKCYCSICTILSSIGPAYKERTRTKSFVLAFRFIFDDQFLSMFPPPKTFRPNFVIIFTAIGPKFKGGDHYTWQRKIFESPLDTFKIFNKRKHLRIQKTKRLHSMP